MAISLRCYVKHSVLFISEAAGRDHTQLVKTCRHLRPRGNGTDHRASAGSYGVMNTSRRTGNGTAL